MILLLYITGEALHWDEVGFAVAWHISEFYQATHLNNVLHYNFSDLLSPASATPKLIELYALHIAIVPLVILLFIFLHFYLVRIKGISLPFWKTPSGQKSPFIKHVKLWLIFGSFMIAAVLLLTIFVGRETGTAPQLLPTSPHYLAKHGPGALGFKPSWPIGWTHGMNLFVEKLGLNPDIWGTVIAGMLMFVSLLLVPFVDRVEKEPENAKGVFNWKRRIWAFLAIALFWGVMITGIIINGVAGPG
jgi:quinol-cytochrome oxidoreductase complex cytochrome b subunit